MPNNEFHYDSLYIDLLNLIRCISVHSAAIHDQDSVISEKKMITLRKNVISRNTKIAWFPAHMKSKDIIK